MNLLDFNDPVWLEPKLRTKRFLCFGKPRLTAILSLAFIAYSLFVTVVFINRDAMPPSAIAMFEVFLICIVSISATHGSIAGEREKRTWETLLVAPVTNAQIVLGKILSGLGACGVLLALLLLPVVITQFGNSDPRPITETMFHQFLVLTFAIAVVSLGVFVSSKSKRAFSAQLLLYLILFITLVVLPGIVSMLGGWMGSTSFIHKLNPMIAISESQRPSEYGGIPVSAKIPFLYLGLSAFLMTITTKRLFGDENSRRINGG
jgi:ABC-type transport system involved in multi-copper enzyme maturation permease subunit